MNPICSTFHYLTKRKMGLLRAESKLLVVLAYNTHQVFWATNQTIFYVIFFSLLINFWQHYIDRKKIHHENNYWSFGEFQGKFIKWEHLFNTTRGCWEELWNFLGDTWSFPGGSAELLWANCHSFRVDLLWMALSENRESPEVPAFN